MTPSLPDLLIGQAAALTAPQPVEAGGDYLAGRVGMLALLAVMMAQEAERGLAARVWENGAIGDLLAKAAPAYRLAPATDGGDLSWRALDQRNADLRRLLIKLHELVEARGDADLDREILALYRAMAHARRLDLPAS